MALPSLQMEGPVARLAIVNPYSEVNWSKSFHLLFGIAREAAVDSYVDEDWTRSFELLFRTKVFFELDLEAIRAGPALFGNAYMSDVDSDDDTLEDAIPCFKVCPAKGAKKPLRFKSTSTQKCTRRSKTAFPIRRAQKLVRKTERGGMFDGRPISYGSYGPYGLEM